MRPSLTAACLAVPTLLALATPDARAATFTSFWAFGDSLTDPGNLYAATGGRVPPAPYVDGRFSNGPVWAEEVAADFAAKGLATGNFAHGFARAVPTGTLPDPPLDVPDLPDQVAAFEAATEPGPGGLLGNRPVAALWFGANDLFAAIRTGDPAAVTATAAAAAAAVIDGIGDLAALGVGDFVVFNLPPLERIPAFTLGTPTAAPLAERGTDAFNAALASGLAGLEGGGLGVATVDIDAAFEALLDDPGSLGLTDAIFPCYVPPGPPESRCSDAALAGKVFFDPVHPTAAVHAAIADLASAEIAPVPLPPALAGLGAALLALAALGRRRAA